MLTERYFRQTVKQHWGYIKNETKKFKIFVANRVQFIQENTKKDQWKYIQTKQNPADLASR